MPIENVELDKPWSERRASTQEMLDDVQSLKDALFQAVLLPNEQRHAIDEKVVKFLTTNKYAVLDILDDALYAHINNDLRRNRNYTV